eukprot:5353929-Pyramimonas_sp.AAC.1
MKTGKRVFRVFGRTLEKACVQSSAAREESSTRLPAVTWLTVYRRPPVIPARWGANWQKLGAGGKPSNFVTAGGLVELPDNTFSNPSN